MNKDNPAQQIGIDFGAPAVAVKVRHGIGASSAAAVCGQSRWKTPLQEYLEQLGLLPPQTETAAMRLGKHLEGGILSEFAARSGKRLTCNQLRRQHPELPWMFCTLDSAIDGQLSELVEAKSSRAREDWGEEDTDEIPREYILQCSHQLAVTGASIVWVPALVCGEFRTYRVERSQSLIDRLIEIETEFWGRVQRREPPGEDWSHPSTAALMAAMYPPKGGVKELDESALAIVGLWEDHKLVARANQERADEQKARLIRLLDGATIGKLPDGREIRRKEISRKAYAVEASTYVDFRICGKVKYERTEHDERDCGSHASA